MLPKSLHNMTHTTVKKNCHILFTLRLCHDINKQNKKQDPKVATDVVNYLESSAEYCDIKEHLPKSLLRKYKTPETMYLINKKTAKDMAAIVKKHLIRDSPLVEVNPGLGLLTRELLQCANKLYLYETSNNFSQHFIDLSKQYPNKIIYKTVDFFGMWKLAFQDKMDQGNRIKELLGDLSTDDNDRIVQIIGSMPGITFVKHLINNVVFHNTTNHLGRPDLYIAMPEHHYQFLTDSEIKLSKHKSVPALFQLLFDYKILGHVPKVHFLPWTYSLNSKRSTMMGEHTLYLVNIRMKQELPCPPEYLPLLWYFFKPHMFSKFTKVIPMLEQWIPGCGVWLITGQDPPDTNRNLSPGENDPPLPHMTIFTEFGDLNFKQKITVFKKFISWPEFEQCQFRATMESNLPKYVSAIDSDDKKTVSGRVEDIEQSDTEN